MSSFIILCVLFSLLAPFSANSEVLSCVEPRIIKYYPIQYHPMAYCNPLEHFLISIQATPLNLKAGIKAADGV